MVTRSGSQTHPGAVEYDIHVLAFPAASPRTVQGLCDLFGVDVQSAQRVIASVPMVLRQHVPAAEAEACAQALRKLGARVLLEPPQQREPPPPPAAAYLQHTAHWPGAGRGANDNLPRPAPRAAAPDLEYDVLSALDAALDEHAGHEPMRGGAPRNLAQELALEQLEEPMESSQPRGEQSAAEASMREGRQDELDLAGGGGAHGSMELELDAGPAHARRKAADARPRKPVQHRSVERDAPSGTTQPRLPIAPTGASRAALVEHKKPAEPQAARSIPLLQLMAACGVFAAGYWTESSVIYGSASLLSVVLHGLALQQLLLGLRGLLR